MSLAIKTIGPLHLEDLEPHRFEDLIRQLSYYFRDWQKLEATGRGGSDDGYDARGFELIQSNKEDPNEDEGETDEDEPPEKTIPSPRTRLWLIQCKREKSITPKKLQKYLEEIPISERSRIHGVIFAAACDFSKASKDIFNETCHSFGFEEYYLWGKAEIEDMLFLPANDHLLFAYTGISLKIRSRSVKSNLRSKLSMKRKAIRHLEENDEVLLRDVSDERYPWLDEDTDQTRQERGRWAVLRFHSYTHEGMRFTLAKRYAFLDDDGIHWDYDEKQKHNNIAHDPWRDQETSSDGWDYWYSLPESNRSWYEISGIIPYDFIIDIDEHGDDWFEGKHVFIERWDEKDGPFIKFYADLETSTTLFGVRSTPPTPETRIEKFTKPAHDIEKSDT